MTILSDILQQKEKEIADLKTRRDPFSRTSPSHIPSMKQTFSRTDHMNIIAEIKRASPSKGAIDLQMDPVEQAKAYEAHGAGAISVLTDETFFNGSMDDLRKIRAAVSIPLLCKDFMIDLIQIDQAKAAGASIILLIVAALNDDRLHHLYVHAKKQGLDVLVEVHNEAEMDRALAIGADIIGINNRNLKTFDVDLHVTEKLAPMVKRADTLLIGESGIRSQDDVTRLRNAGVEGVLIGETLMRASDLPEAFTSLQIPKQKGSIADAR